MREDFVIWLNQQLDQRGWSRSEAARRGGISASSLDKVIGGFAKPGQRFCQGIARAFGLPVEDVMRRAGILPTGADILPEVRDWNERLLAIPENRRQEAVDALESVLRALESRDRRPGR